jgi:hypothetical protein
MNCEDKIDDLDSRVDALLARAYQLASSDLNGINEAAEELAALSGDDIGVLYRARRVVLERMAIGPDRATKQVVWLIRRALEVGSDRWRWKDTGPVP